MQLLSLKMNLGYAAECLSSLTLPVTSTLAHAMAQATREILADPDARVFGGGRPEARRVRDAFDINCGLCEEWATRVEDLCPGASALDPGNLSGDADDSLEHGHVFVRHGGRFYDSECPEGVTDWKQLPLFNRNRQLDAGNCKSL